MNFNSCPFPAFCSPLPFGSHRARPVLHRLNRTPRAQAQPPKTKPVFYRNPSKAIEKGGGFYVPGLRGPRLRFFVASIAGSLLTINHLVSNVTATSLANSERLAAVGILAVFASAVYDSVRFEDDEPDTSASSDISAVSDSANETFLSNDEAFSTSATDSWAMTVCTDLTPVTHIAHFRKQVLHSFTDNVVPGALPGEAVERVSKEARSIFISDTSALPSQVTFPFLGDGAWSVYLVPKEDDVVAFAKKGKDGLSVEDRRWLGVFVKQYF
ncbi:Cofactor assembly of complex C subunit B [Gracilaria domingensis]|nr:Cofactor assembly of complex C subunit B [Gracilaria domingensis]